MNLLETYYNEVNMMMKYVVENESDTISKAAISLSQCIDEGNHIYLFGTGHSYIISQEVFARAGGYAGFTPILLNELGMNHAFKSTLIERTKEYADVILGLYHFCKGDVIILTSNSGRNKLIIELALRLREIGVTIISITSLEESKCCTSRHESGLRLFEVSDMILDNRTVFGDACISHGNDIQTGPTSTIMGCFLIQSLVSAFVQLEVDKGKQAPVFHSSNTDQGDVQNKDLFQLYK